MRRPMFTGIPVRTSVSVMALNVGYLGGFFMPRWLVNDLLVCVNAAGCLLRCRVFSRSRR